MTAQGDYARCVGKYIAAKDDDGSYSRLVFDPPEATRDSAWHEKHGYMLHNGVWIAEILLRSQLAHEDAILTERETKRIAALERACLTYGPQPLAPFADIADEMQLAEAAD